MSRPLSAPSTKPSGPRWLRALLGMATAAVLVVTPATASATGGVEPLDDEQWAAHVAELDAAVDQAKRQGKSTDVLYTVNGDGVHWLAPRVLQQREVADDLYAKGVTVPDEGKAVLTGGLPGAGKTTALAANPFIDTKDYLVLNSDDAKETMCEHGMIPEFDGFAPMETADLIQREAALITRMVADRAYRDRKNVIWDTTMSSAEAVDQRVGPLRAAGYDEIAAVFIDVPIEVSVQRVDYRHRTGYEKFRNGDLCNGRHVPADFVRKHADAEWGSVNRRAFEQTKERFDRWYLYDSAVLPPTLVGQG